MKFYWICCKSCHVAFCLVLQFTADVMGGRKSAMIHSNRPLFFAPMVVLFLLCILIWTFYSEENNWYHQPITTSQYKRWRLILSVRCILSAPKHINKIKISLAQQPGAYGNESLRFFCCPRGFKYQVKCDSAVCVTNLLKTNFSYTFWLLEVAVIARTNYNC